MLHPMCNMFLSHESSKIIQSTEHIHKFAIEVTTNTIDFIIQHDTPYPIRSAIVHGLQDLASFGDSFGSFILSVYFSLIYYIIGNM